MLNRCPGAAVMRDQNLTRNDQCPARDRESADAPAPLSEQRLRSFGRRLFLRLYTLRGSGGDLQWFQKSLSGLSGFILVAPPACLAILRNEGDIKHCVWFQLRSANCWLILQTAFFCCCVFCVFFLSPVPGTANANWHIRSYSQPC